MRLPIRLSAVFVLLGSHTGWADMVEFNNGDRIQGEIVSMQDGILKFNSVVLGEVSVALEKVKRFSTDTEAELHFQDGTVLKQQVQAAGEGEIIVKEGALVGAQTLPLNQLKNINPPPVPPVTWEGRITSGLVIDRGNTDSQDLNLDIHAKRETGQDRIILDAEFNEKRETNQDTGKENTSKRRYEVGGHYDYFVSPRYYVYGDVNAEKEATANLDLRLNIGGGAGYRWIKNETTNLDLEAGLGWVNESFSDASKDNDYISMRTAWRYSHDLNTNVHLFHNGEWFPSLDDFEDQLVKTETGIRSKVNGHLSVEAKVVFDWDQTPADGAEKEDTTYIFGVGWDF